MPSLCLSLYIYIFFCNHVLQWTWVFNLSLTIYTVNPSRLPSFPVPICTLVLSTSTCFKFPPSDNIYGNLGCFEGEDGELGDFTAPGTNGHCCFTVPMLHQLVEPCRRQAPWYILHCNPALREPRKTAKPCIVMSWMYVRKPWDHSMPTRSVQRQTWPKLGKMRLLLLRGSHGNASWIMQLYFRRSIPNIERV